MAWVEGSLGKFHQCQYSIGKIVIPMLVIQGNADCDYFKEQLPFNI